jgi:hypothetical protein
METPPLLAASRPRDWSERNWKWFLPVMLAVGALLCGGLLMMVFGLMKSSVAYSGALERARASPEVRDALGAPIEDGLYVTGQINVSGPDGRAELSFPIRGPRGAATVYVAAARSLGEWHFEHVIVEVDGSGKRMELCEAQTRRVPPPEPAPGSGAPQGR